MCVCVFVCVCALCVCVFVCVLGGAANLICIYYPPEVRSMKYCRLGVFMLQYSLLVNPLQ